MSRYFSKKNFVICIVHNAGIYSDMDIYFQWDKKLNQNFCFNDIKP